MTHAVLFRSFGVPFGADLSAVELPPDITHSAMLQHLKDKDADGAWVWASKPDEAQILAVLREGRTIASVEGASLLVVHPDHRDRWDKCEAEVYWGAVEGLYAAEPDAPPLVELLSVLDKVRKNATKPLGGIKRLQETVRAQVLPILALGDSVDTRDSLRLVAEQFIYFGVFPEYITRLLPGGVLQTMLYAARLARPRERRALVAAAPLVGLPDLLG